MSDDRHELHDEGLPDEAYALDAFKRECELPATAFAKLHGNAFLLLHRTSRARLERPARVSRTLVTPARRATQDLPPSKYLVYPVRKTERSLIGRFYSVGQTRNNDIVLRDVSVSKFHAFFQDASDGGVLLQDARSTNGTFVNGTRVAAQGRGEAVLVATGDRLRFGNVELSFLDAASFRQLLERVFPRGGS